MATKKTTSTKSASVRVSQQRPKVAPKKMAGIRMTEADLAIVDEAAGRVNRTRSKFVVIHALEAARRVLGTAAS